MARRRARKNTKQSESSENAADKATLPLQFDDQVERQIATIRALRDMEIEQLKTMLRLLRTYLRKDQLQVPVLQFFKENFPKLCMMQNVEDGQFEVKSKDKDGNFSINKIDEGMLHASLLHKLSMAYPDCSAAMPSFGGFEFSNKSVKSSLFGADKLQIRSLVFEEPSDSQMSELQDGLQTPGVTNQRLSVGMTPTTLRLPKPGEMLLSVHGSPLGVYKEENMETIQESEDD